MIYLFLSILSSSLIFIAFKWMGKLNMNTLLVIVINYLVAATTGILMYNGDFVTDAINLPGLFWTLILGSGFVLMFYAMAIATHRSGAAPAAVANKMSVVIPVAVAFLFLNESITIMKISGIILALTGIYFSTKKKEKSGMFSRNFLLLLFVFIGSGIIDTSLKLIEKYYLNEGDVILFASTLFLTAFLSGLVILSFRVKQHVKSFYFKKIWMGIFLGLVNFGSIYFLVLALKSPGMESSVLFPLNNIGVVVLSTLLSILFFKEKLSAGNIFGLTLSVLALIVLMIS